MRREAKVGLAVVLVLGLSVTFLVGRSLYVRARDKATAQINSTADDSTCAR